MITRSARLWMRRARDLARSIPERASRVTRAARGGDGSQRSDESAATVGLQAHTEHFARRIETVAPGIHSAIGYGLANVVIIEAEGGVIIVDTLESRGAAADLRADLDELCPGPVLAIIYTHNHTDHIFGGTALARDGHPEVIAHRSTADLIRRIAGVLRPAIYTRSMRQFGTMLSKPEFINAGIGPELRFSADDSPELLWPTRVIDDHETLEVGGVSLEIFHAPGETPDHLNIWLPEHKLLICGDNFYHAFPNLYAIRGTAWRDVSLWVASLDRARSYPAEVLVPCHGAPIVGRDEIAATLRDYRDAISYVYHQTIRGMNAGLTPDELANSVRLPTHLASRPYLAEHYGRVDWSVRAIFAGNLGWFSGDACDLDPLPRSERAPRLVALAGGEGALLAAAQSALDSGDHRWALELGTTLFDANIRRSEAAGVRAQALRALAQLEPSANGRNYRLTQALEAEGFEIPRPSLRVSAKNMLAELSIDAFFAAMQARVDPKRAAGVESSIAFQFTDIDRNFTLCVRRGATELSQSADSDANATLTTTTLIWKELAVGIRRPAGAVATGKLKIRGDAAALTRVLLCFDRE